MSIRVMTQVWDSDLPRDEKYILLSLADWASDDGSNVYPSLDRVSWKTGYSIRQVKNIVKDLKDKGYLERDGGRSSYNTIRYKIVLDALPSRDPFEFKEIGRPSKESAENAPSFEEEDKKESAKIASSFDRETLEEDKKVQFLPKESAISSKESAIVAQNPLDNTSSNPSVKNTGGEKAAAVVSGEGESSSLIKNPSAYKALQAWEKRAADPGLDVSEFPEDVRSVVVKFAELWKVTIPKKPKGKRGGDFADWIRDSRYLQDACEEWGLELLEEVYADYASRMEEKGAPPYVVARPGALIKVAKAKAAEKRLSGSKSLSWIEEEERARKAAEEMRAKVRAAKEKRAQELGLTPANEGQTGVVQ